MGIKLSGNIKYINNTKKYFNRLYNQTYKPYYSSIFYMNTYTDTIGRLTFEKINNLNNLGFISKVKIIF